MVTAVVPLPALVQHPASHSGCAGCWLSQVSSSPEISFGHRKPLHPRCFPSPRGNDIRYPLPNSGHLWKTTAAPELPIGIRGGLCCNYIEVQLFLPLPPVLSLPHKYRSLESPPPSLLHGNLCLGTCFPGAQPKITMQLISGRADQSNLAPGSLPSTTNFYCIL